MGIELLNESSFLSKELVNDQTFRNFLPQNNIIIAVNYKNIPQTFTNISVGGNNGYIIPYVATHTFRPDALYFDIVTDANFTVTVFLFDTDNVTGNPNNQLFNTKEWNILGRPGLQTITTVYYKNEISPMAEFPIIYEGFKYWWLIHCNGPVSNQIKGFSLAQMYPEFIGSEAGVVANTGFNLSPAQPLNLSWDTVTIPPLARSLTNTPYIALRSGGL